MRFLASSYIQAQVRRLASGSDEVMAAVAYWGKDAAEQTGFAEHKNPEAVRVICDLLSGACSPDEIETLTHLGFSVRTLDRLHAKVWIAGDDVIVGSANASHNGLPGDAEEAANASIEAAVLSHDPTLAREAKAWFEMQWCDSSKIEDWHFVKARDMWSRRHRTGGRGFTTPLTEQARHPGSRDRFADLRLLAYLREDSSPGAENHVAENARLYFDDEEWQEFGEEHPWFEWPIRKPVWPHKRGTVFADFNCETQGGEFVFNGFWQIRNCPDIELREVRLTLLTKLPHCNGYFLTPKEQQVIAKRIREVVAEREYREDVYGFYIDENFLEFWDTECA